VKGWKVFGIKVFDEIREKIHIMKYFLCVIGMVMIVEGLPYFIFPEKMKSWMKKIIEMHEGALRWAGFTLMLAGLLLVYLGRR